MQDFVRDFVFGLNVNDGSRVGIILFADDASIAFNLSSYNTQQSVLEAMNFPYTGGKCHLCMVNDKQWQRIENTRLFLHVIFLYDVKIQFK